MQQEGAQPNLTHVAREYASNLNAECDEVFWHAVAILHSESYRQENLGALQQDWPRLPLPKNKELLSASAALGREVALLLQVGTSVKGVNQAPMRPELTALGVVSSVSGTLNPEEGDMDITASWGHSGKGGITMPAKGKVIERQYSNKEMNALRERAVVMGTTLEAVLECLGGTTFDVFLNQKAFWSNIPSAVWNYTLGGYQVIKKWLSYREKTLLGRSITTAEARHITTTARRIAAILLLTPSLDANFEAVRSSQSKSSVRKPAI